MLALGRNTRRRGRGAFSRLSRPRTTSSTSSSTTRLTLEECEVRQLLAVFTVTSPLDTGAVGELRWAVTAANTTPGPDQITFDDSITQINLVQGELTITDPVAINQPAPSPALVEINAAVNSRIFRVDDSNPMTSLAVSMAQLQLRQGDLSAFAGSQGGTILNHENLTMHNCFINESIAFEGGAIANHGWLGMNNCAISESTALGTGGGAIWNAPGGIAEIVDGKISGNEATMGAGGGILTSGNSLVTLSGDLQLHHNTADQNGGGLAVADGAAADLGVVVVEFNESPLGGGISVAGTGSNLSTGPGTTIQSNSAGIGGGVAVVDRATANLRGSLVSGNLARVAGGGIAATSLANLDLAGTQISTNRAGTSVAFGRGGGIYAQSGAQVDVRNSVISYNGATAIGTNIDEGGGAFAGSGVVMDIDNSTISGNVAVNGGGVFAAAATDGLPGRADLYLSNTNIVGNFAYDNGAGVHAGRNSDVMLKCVTIANNYALGGFGGGLHLEGAAAPNGVVADVVDSTIVENRADQNGGGISSRNGAELSMTNSIVSNNQANERGGGLYLTGGMDGNGLNRTEVQLSLISGNRAETFGVPYANTRSGGGIWAGNMAVVDIDTTTIEANTATAFGGGIAVRNTGSFEVRNSTVSGNSSTNGGGAAVVRSNATFLQTTFNGNQAESHGGGFYIQSTLPNSVDIVHSTISLNSAASGGSGRGGGIYAGNVAATYALQVNLDHTIVSRNLGAPLGGFDEVYDGGYPVGQPLVSASYSLLRDNNGTTFLPGFPDPNGNIIGTVAAPIDAQLMPLGANGGPTLTMQPGLLSPVVNAGDPLFMAPPVGDQRQLPYKRVALGRIDMGAVELQPPPPDVDFNNDGVADCSDVDPLVLDIAAGNNTPTFDLTGDGFVDFADLVKWLDDAPEYNGLAISAYLPGDANLDTIVDGLDFIIWNSFKFTPNTGWCQGNFNADGATDGQDFIIWNVFKFTAAPVPTGCGLFRNEAVTVGHHLGETAWAVADAAGAEATDQALAHWEADDGLEGTIRSLAVDDADSPTATELITPDGAVGQAFRSFEVVDDADDDETARKPGQLVFG